MSRSRKKTPIFGNTTARSEKWFKTSEHKRERRLVKMLLLSGKEDMPHKNQFADPWFGPKDGRHWWSSEFWRKVWNEEQGRHITDERRADLFAKYMRK